MTLIDGLYLLLLLKNLFDGFYLIVLIYGFDLL